MNTTTANNMHNQCLAVYKIKYIFNKLHLPTVGSEAQFVSNNIKMHSTENQFVNFKIIIRNSNGNKFRWWSFAVVISFSCFLIFFDEPTPAVVTGIVFCAMIALLIFFAIKLQLLEEYDEAGWLMLTHHYIVLKIGNEEIEYAIDKTTTLSLELQGYTGEPIIGQWIEDKKGHDNFISLTNNNGTVRHEILISNKMKISIMDRLLGHYSRSGVIVQYVDKSSDDSKKSLIQRIWLALRHAR